MPTSIQLQIGTKQQSPEANVHTVCSFTSHAPTLQNATLTKFVQPPLGTDYPSQQIQFRFICLHSFAARVLRTQNYAKNKT